MYGMMNVSKSGMSSNQNKLNVISNNMVNATTTGYKRLEVEFQDLVRESLNIDSYPVNKANTDIGSGVRCGNEIRNTMQGSLKQSGIKTDLAIDGEGFFRVMRPNNTYAYTRNGEFAIDASGKLVDDSGNVLDIQFYNNNSYETAGLTNENFTVDKMGQVYAGDELVGKINLYTGTGDNDFLSVGDSLFVPKDGVNLNLVNDSSIMQGYKEMSNVNLGQEMTDLISVQRAFQLNSRGMTVADDMWSMINNLQSR